MEKTTQEVANTVKLFKTEAEKNPLQFIELKEQMLNSFSKFGYDLSTSKAIKQQLIEIQQKLIDKQNQRMEYAFELCFSIEKQDAYNEYVAKIRSIQESYCDTTGQTIDKLIGVMNENTMRILVRKNSIKKQFEDLLSKGIITEDEFKYETEVRFQKIIDSAIKQGEKTVEYLIAQYNAHIELTLDRLNSAIEQRK